MRLIATLTAIISISTNLALALPAAPQAYLGDANAVPLWASDANPPSLDQNIQSTTTRLPIRVDHPFIVPVDREGRPTGKPSVPSDLMIWPEEVSMT